MATTTLESIKKVTSQGFHTGDIVWWALRSAEVDAVAFRKKWIEEGLPEESLSDPASPHRLLKKAGEDALRSFRSNVHLPAATPPPGGTAPQDGPAGFLLRPVGRLNGRSMFGVVREIHQPGTERNLYTQVGMVAVDESTGQFLSDNPQDPIAAAAVCAIAALYNQRAGKMLAGEVAWSILCCIERLGGVSLRGSGGVYWIPASHSTEVRALQRVVDSIGGSRFDVLPVHDSAEGNRALAEAARNSLEARVATLRAEIDGWVTSAKTTRTKTLEARLAEYDELKARAGSYAQLLSTKVDDLLAKMDGLRATAQALLDQRTPGEEPEDKEVEAPADRAAVSA